MKLSIILPIYNVEKYLSACIDSILSQTFKDYEIILVDDGAKDSSPQICDEYSSRFDFIKTIHKPNGGSSDARNVGLKNASGEYIFFVDSDDYLIDNNVLQKIDDALLDGQDVVAFKSIKWFESNGQLSNCPYSFDVETQNRSAADIYLELIDKDAYYNSAWSKVIKRSLLVDNQIEFEKGLLSEDNDWYYKVVSYINTLALIDEPLYVYRQRAGSITQSATTKNLDHLFWIIEKWMKYVNEGELTGNKKIIRNSLSKQYCHAIIMYASIGSPKGYSDKLATYNYLLQYSNTPRVKTFRKLNKFIGLRGTVALLKLAKLIKK